MTKMQNFTELNLFIKSSQNSIQGVGEDIRHFWALKVIFVRSDKKGEFLFVNFNVLGGERFPSY
jgi:hypothetical protein